MATESPALEYSEASRRRIPILLFIVLGVATLAFALLITVATIASGPVSRSADAVPQLVFFGTWPHNVVIFDAEAEKICGTIDLKTDAPRALIL